MYSYIDPMGLLSFGIYFEKTKLIWSKDKNYLYINVHPTLEFVSVITATIS